MRRAALYSFLLHFVVFLFLFFGIPWFPHEKPDLMRPIPVEVITIAEETMAPKPAVKPVKEEPKPEEKKPEPQPEPEKPAPPPVPEPEPEPAPKPEIKEPVPAPQPKPVPPAPKKKEKPKKQEKPKDKKPEKKKKEESFDSILKNLEDMKEKIEDDSDAPSDPEAPAPAKQTGKVGDKLTISELDLLSAHFKKCWSMPAGAQGAENLSVRIRIWSHPDGTVKDAQIVDNGRFSADPYYRIAAEAALRAAKDPRCAKLPLSLEKYNLWKVMVLNFDPRFLLGG